MELSIDLNMGMNFLLIQNKKGLSFDKPFLFFGGAGGTRTRVQNTSTVGTTCLFCLLFNYVELRQTGFRCSWPNTISRFTLRQGSLAILLG